VDVNGLEGEMKEKALTIQANVTLIASCFTQNYMAKAGVL
jgi:hypothetical protein